MREECSESGVTFRTFGALGTSYLDLLYACCEFKKYGGEKRDGSLLTYSDHRYGLYVPVDIHLWRSSGRFVCPLAKGKGKGA